MALSEKNRVCAVLSKKDTLARDLASALKLHEREKAQQKQQMQAIKIYLANSFSLTSTCLWMLRALTSTCLWMISALTSTNIRMARPSRHRTTRCVLLRHIE